MSGYALHPETMLNSMSKVPSQILGLPQPDSEPKEHIRESTGARDNSISSFSIRSYPPDAAVPQSFDRMRLISRAHLPLTYLDTSPDQSFTSRIFSANLEVLETRNGSKDEDVTISKVLIARRRADDMLYAIERVQPGIYSLCRLAGWLKERDIELLSGSNNTDMRPSLLWSGNAATEAGSWWQRAAVKTEPWRVPVRKPRLAMLRPSPQQKVERIGEVGRNLPDPFQESSVPDIGVEAHLVEPLQAPNPQQLLDSLVQQYLDAVYLSKTSLAYFVKGPITRVRNVFTSAEEGAPRTCELVDFLRSMLLSHKAGEKKYLEKLPEVVKAILPAAFSDDEPAHGSSKPKRSKKKMKISREGMYPHEDDIVRRWWVSDIPGQDHHGDETLEQRIKRRVGDLRVRETLAQMILMLEIIALEALSNGKEFSQNPSHNEQQDSHAGNDLRPEGSNPFKQGQEQAGDPPALHKKRKKKMDNVRLLLDLLLDKLCIWQSVDQDGILDFDAKSPSTRGEPSKTAKSGGGDRLQSFCVEVIIPFYMSRLPEQAVMICKKLGGPVQASPPKRKATKPPLTSRKSGEPKEPEAKKARRSLNRVATDTVSQIAQRGTTPSLNRSATDSTLVNGIKREASEVPLAAIPFQRSPSTATARPSLSHFKHLKGRQIDLSAPSAATAAKLKQKKRVEEDLREAITALKKPNRGLAAGSYVDEIEKLGLGLNNRSRKPATTVRKIQKDVQVSATPRVGSRTKIVVEATPSHRRDPFARDLNETIPSSSFCIPSSAARSVVPATVQRNVLERTATAPAVTETPSRPPTRKILDSPGACRRAIFAPTTTITGKPAQASKEKGVSASPGAIFATPLKPRRNPPTSPTAKTGVIFATPIKDQAIEEAVAPAAVAATPIKPGKLLESEPGPSNTNEGTETSIYDALGWNDDDDFF
ncbi:uncharacterized protein EI97DRAFT_435097 [Westerdykella ornata]|uniref:DNA replication regulator Sld3 C-terminal domain-containing protein n=1 Tax=Westerdykella ornata TaxID=318751 RepID=A0A6A6JG06_WESOR|nr:uncharacterized protein EI97DRAFT_435097 [Westerdykella ornata]KAF2274556.1 hypothetical protein EI97DRAFT_435097 [Westerdykella ornata]